MLRTTHPPFTYRYHKCDAEGGNKRELGIPQNKLKERTNHCVYHKVG